MPIDRKDPKWLEFKEALREELNEYEEEKRKQAEEEEKKKKPKGFLESFGL